MKSMKRFLGFLPMLLAARVACATPCENGLYLYENWLQPSSKTSADLRQLGEKLKTASVRDVYIKVRDLSPEGLRLAEKQIQELRRSGPLGLRVHAWLGRRNCSQPGEKNCFALSEAASRTRLKGQAQRLWASPAFDAVHLNVEPVANGDADFIDLLDQLQSAKPRGKKLSLAGYLMSSKSYAPKPRGGQRPLEWSEDYYRKLAARIDQLMVMSYDTALFSEAGYQTYVRSQTEAFRRLGMPPQLRMGLPAYQTGRAGLYDAKLETLRAASLGVRDALASAECPAGFGVASYVESEMDADEWADFASWGSQAREDKKRH